MNKTLHLDLPDDATVYSDQVYTDQPRKDTIAETEQVWLHVAQT